MAEVTSAVSFVVSVVVSPEKCGSGPFPEPGSSAGPPVQMPTTSQLVDLLEGN